MSSILIGVKIILNHKNNEAITNIYILTVLKAGKLYHLSCQGIKSNFHLGSRDID